MAAELGAVGALKISMTKIKLKNGGGWAILWLLVIGTVFLTDKGYYAAKMRYKTRQETKSGVYKPLNPPTRGIMRRFRGKRVKNAAKTPLNSS